MSFAERKSGFKRRSYSNSIAGTMGKGGQSTVVTLFLLPCCKKIAHVPYFCSNSYLNAVSAFAMTAPVSGTAGTVAEDHFKIPV